MNIAKFGNFMFFKFKNNYRKHNMVFLEIFSNLVNFL